MLFHSNNDQGAAAPFEEKVMDLLEALAYVIGFFLIWGCSMGFIWAVSFVFHKATGKHLVNPEFWQ